MADPIQQQLRAAMVNEVCYRCHAEKRGPFLWMHAPVAMNCLNCHLPHGSVNQHMLVINMPVLCQRCHIGTRHPSEPHRSGTNFRDQPAMRQLPFADTRLQLAGREIFHALKREAEKTRHRWAAPRFAAGPGGNVMNLKRLFAGCGTMALVLSMLSPALAQVDLGQYTAQGSVEAGAIPQPVPYNDVAKYQEYRDLAQQFIVPKLQLILGDKAENYYVQFDAVNVAQKNQMYSLRFGEYGLLDVQAKFFEIPHFFSDHVASTRVRRKRRRLHSILEAHFTRRRSPFLARSERQTVRHEPARRYRGHQRALYADAVAELQCEHGLSEPHRPTAIRRQPLCLAPARVLSK